MDNKCNKNEVYVLRVPDSDSIDYSRNYLSIVSGAVKELLEYKNNEVNLVVSRHDHQALLLSRFLAEYFENVNLVCTNLDEDYLVETSEGWFGILSLEPVNKPIAVNSVRERLAVNKLNEILNRTSSASGKYVLREQGEESISTILKAYGNESKEKVLGAYKQFGDSLVKLFKEVFENYSIDVVAESYDIADAVVKLRKEFDDSEITVVSVDYQLKGHINIKVSRVFNLYTLQNFCYGLHVWNESEVHKNLPLTEGNVLLVDDDSISSYVFEGVKEMLPSTVTNVVTRTLLEQGSDLYDVVDIRDFLLGADRAGLCVKSKGKVFRAPYIEPYTSLSSRASIPCDIAEGLSRRILDLNIEFYSEVGDIKLKECPEAFIDFALSVSPLKEDATVLELIDYIY